MEFVATAAFIVLVVLAVAVLLQIVFGRWLGWTRWLPFRGGLLGGFVLFREASMMRALVNHLAAITHMNLPLADALTVAGQGERGALGRLLRRTGSAVAGGMPLSSALRRTIAGCPPLVTSVVAAGERAGQLPRALADLEVALADQLRAETPGPLSSGRFWLYPVALVLANMFIVSFVMIVVVPKFEEIFLDFDTQLPDITVNLIAASNWLVRGALPGFLLLGVPGLVVVAAVVGAVVLRRSDDTVTQVLLDVGGWIPVLTRPVAFGKGMSIAVRVVRMGLGAGMTLPDAAALASSVRINRFLQRRWEDFSRMLKSGLPASRAAREAGLGNILAWACRSLERDHTDPQLVLEHAADYYRALAVRWWRALGRTAWPAVTCLLGCMVGYVVVALFLPLVSLINAVSGS
ncbi:MAG: hypothetical protein GY778_03035 [bacterium]|nr:hypothetical protein [bacterium]